MYMYLNMDPVNKPYNHSKCSRTGYLVYVYVLDENIHVHVDVLYVYRKVPKNEWTELIIH